MLIPQTPQHSQAGIECNAQGAVGFVAFDVVADICHVGDVAEEPAMRARHVAAHIVDEIVTWGWSLPFLLAIALGSAAVRTTLACGAMLDTKYNIEELDEATLGVARPTELSVRLLACAVIEHNAIGEACIGHVLPTGEERPDAVVEDVRITILVHSLEKGAEFVEALGEGLEIFSHGSAVVDAGSVDGVEHEGD